MAGILDMLSPTTIANYARGAWDNVSQNNPIWSKLKGKGRIQYNVGGTTIEGPIEAGRHTAIVSAPGMDLTEHFQPKVRHQRYSFPWGEIAAATVIDRGMLRRNSGQQALVNLREDEIPAMLRDLIVGDNGLAHQFLRMNGSTYTGTGLPMYGLPSFLPVAGTANLVGFNPATDTATGAGVADTDQEVTPGASFTTTYGGLSMIRSGLTGVDNLEPDAWTPTLVNSSWSGWTGTADDEDDAILKFLQHAVNRSCRFSSSDQSKSGDLGLISKDWFAFLGNKIADKQTIYVQSSQGSVQTPNLGYKSKSLMHAGIEWFWDENLAAENALVLNTSYIWFKVQELYKNLEDGSPLTVTGEDAGIMEVEVTRDPIRRQYLVSATIPGQFIANPRYHVRVANFS